MTKPMTMRLVLTAAVVLAVLGAIGGPAAQTQGQSIPADAGAATALPPPLPPGPAPDLDLVFTAEVSGYVEPCG